MNTRRALVTGASSGIGESFCRALALRGYAVTVVSRNQHRLEQLCRELGGEGHRSIVADLSSAADTARVAADVAAGGYHLLVNNAGVGAGGNFEAAPIERLQRLVRLNCEAVVTLAHSFMQSAEPGASLINVGSVLSFVPCPGSAVYSATKAFVLSLSEGLWHECRRRGVYVMALCPGSTATHFFDNARLDGSAARPPALLTQTADEVVRAALAEFDRRKKPTVVTGLLNKLIPWFPRLLARKTLIQLMSNGERYLKNRVD